MSPVEAENHLTGLEIAVIGMAGRFPGAKNIHEFWDNLSAGRESISFFSHEELNRSGISAQMLNNPHYVKAYGWLEDIEYFDASFFGYLPSEAEIMDPQIRIFHECALEVLENAGYDPYQYKKNIGLFVGAADSVQWQSRVEFSKQDNISQWFSSMQLHNKDFLATRLAHKLNLRGPAFTVDTACSTSLVVLHQACQGLICGDCDMALAGGVTISIALKKIGYPYQEGMLLSPDGHCRSFDARARGTIFSNGAGVVVLKRLEDAIEDNDTIYALVKGSAVNNDGSGRAAFSAPNTRGQAEVIRKALLMAETDPETIGYIETHGTGTTLGDPVEIDALKAAFNTRKKHFCRIGSLKTNVGHLQQAAGIAAFIKTVLVLKHQIFPPSLFFETPNPRIDFENSPFIVNTGLTEWKPGKYPRRAGVSSFGIGGTNAHVVLEEWPTAQSKDHMEQGAQSQGRGGVSPPNPSRQYQLILLSAKTPAALEKMTENLTEYFKKSLLNPGNPVNPRNPGQKNLLNHDNRENPAHTGPTLTDAAYTLQVGRCVHKHRRMLVCPGVNEAIALLSSLHPGKVKTYSSPGDNCPLVFLIPGLGAQYVNMGREIYEKEPLFREEMDRCFENLKPLLEYDIKEILYPVGEPAGSIEGAHHSAFGIRHFEVAQIVMFIFAYALARLLMKWGIKPDAMMGYSFGEYVAACVSGVFSLEDALKLVVARGRLIQKMPAGAMLSVPLPKSRLQPLVDANDELSLAIDNGPSCIISGPNEVIAAFEKQMQEQKILCMPVPGSRAIHSKMTTPILAELQEVLDTIPLNKPQIPYISNVTGDWISGEEAKNPKYWTNQLRQTVQFDKGMKTLLKESNAIFVEIGPGRDISALTARYFEDNRHGERRVINLVRHQQQNIPDVSFLLNKIGMLWFYGQSIDWTTFNWGEKRQRIPLPTYPFEKKWYWIDEPSIRMAGKELPAQPLPHQRLNITDWFYIPSWKRSIPPRQVDWKNTAPMIWLVFLDTCWLGPRLVNQLQNNGQVVITVNASPFFSKINTREYMVNPAEDKHYETLFIELGKDRKIPHKIIHLWNVTGTSESQHIQHLDKIQDAGYYSLINIAKAAGKLGINHDLHIMVVTDSMQECSGEDQLCPLKAAILGPVKVIPKEYDNISMRSIDILLPEPGSSREEKLIENLLKEFMTDSPDSVIAFRDHHRWVEIFEPMPLTGSGRKIPPLRQEGVYIITGGLGGIGLALAGYLAKEVSAKLVLIGRSPLPPRDRWAYGLTTHEDETKSRKIRDVLELEKSGARVMVFSADVSDPGQMQTVVQQVKKEWGTINGIIHGAGLADGTLIQLRTRETSEAVLAAKIKGTLVLDTIFKDESLDFFVLCSSMDALITSAGQVGYCAANNFLDAFARYKAYNQGPLTISINWPRWKGVGIAMIAENLHKKMKGDDLPGGISMEEGVETFCRILFQPMPQVAVFDQDIGTAVKHNYTSGTNLIMEEFETVKTPSSIYQRPNLITEYAAPGNQLEENLAIIWGRLFGLEPIGIRDDFFELGGDSLKAITMTSIIHKELDVALPLTEFFNNPTIERLAEYIKRTGRKTYSSIMPEEKKEYYPLSSAQKRLYLLQQLVPESTPYNEFFTIQIEEEPKIAVLKESFKTLIQRHEILRTSFEWVNDEPVQRVHDKVDFEIEYYSLEPGADSPGSTTDVPVIMTDESIIDRFIRPFDLSRTPLMRPGLIKTAGAGHILMIDIHHIITDGITNHLLIKELMTLYAGRSLPWPRLHYKDYSRWQNGPEERETLKKQETYWINRFQDEIPVLKLATDYARPAMQRFEGNNVDFEISAEETRALNAAALSGGSTLFMVLVAVFNILLSKLSGQEEIIMGTPVACRRHADLENIIGMFVNTLALRNYPAGDRTFREFLAEAKERTLKAFENQEYPFEELVDKLAVKRDMGRNPLFDVSIVMQNMETETGAVSREKETGNKTSPPDQPAFLGDKEYEHIDQTAKFDLSIIAVERGGGLYLSFQYCTKLFRKETIERFTIYFKKIASMVVKEPDIRISEIEIVSEEEKNRLLYEFNDTEVDYPKDKTIHQLFEKQVEQSPDRVAVVGPLELKYRTHMSYKTYISYRQLDEKSDRLTHFLREKSVGPDTIVAIKVERSVEMIIGIHGIIKAGGAYLPIDPDYPQDRIDYILKDSGAKILLTEQEIAGLYPPQALKISPKGTPSHLHLPPVPATSLAYIIYTSGSTGKPKGTLIQHFSVVNRLYWMQKRYPLMREDVILQKTPFSFDVSVWELFWWGIVGARLCLLAPGGEKDPGVIAKAVELSRISVIHFVPSMLGAFMDYISAVDTQERLSALKWVFSSGEALRGSHVSQFNHFFARSNKTRLINLYGPTEATVDVSYFDCPPGENLDRVPIGKPIDNTGLFVLDRQGRLQPIGVTGELYIAGVSLARGYLNRPELTAEKFNQDYHSTCTCNLHLSPLAKSAPPGRRRRRIYKTGDLARWLPDGDVEFLGRIDHQVKIRGFRIELGEIENRLAEHPGIKEAAALVQEEENGDKYICAYIVTDREYKASGLREFLLKGLPGYIIPSYFVCLEKFPLTANGKLDRGALPLPELENKDSYTPPGNEIEKKLAVLWAEVLGGNALHASQLQTSIGIHNNFFEWGGHSLKATILAAKIHKVFGVKVSLLEIFKMPTIKALAKYIKGKSREFYLSINPVEEKEYYALSSAQKRLYFLHHFNLTGIGYNMPLVFSLGKEIEKDEIQWVLQRLIDRHESLRTSFKRVDEEVVQKIHKPGSIEFSLDYYEAGETSLGEIYKNYIKPFDLSRAPLIRSGLIRQPDGQQTWMVDMHHIISDGISQTIVSGDFMSLYNRNKGNPAAVLEPLPIQYKDFAQWQNRRFESGEIRAQEEYWLELYRGEIPRVNLPADNKRPGVFTFAGDGYEFCLAKEDTRGIKVLGERYGATLYMNMLAVLNTLFYKYTGQTDIIIGTGTAGRKHVDLQGVVGMFVNTLALRNYPRGKKTYEAFLKEISQRCIEAFAHQDVQFEDLVEKLAIHRDPSRNPLFDISMVVHNFLQSEEGVRLDSPAEKFQSLRKGEGTPPVMKLKNLTSIFDLTFSIIEQGEDIFFNIVYYTGIFKEETIRRLALHLKNIIKTINHDPSIKLEDIEIIPQEERSQLLYKFNDTMREYPGEKTLQELFNRIVDKQPDHIGVRHLESKGGETAVTYRELQQESHRLGNYLYDNGTLGGESVVGILMERSIDQVIALLSILKAGGAYLPIDVSLPVDRIIHMLDDACVGLVLTRGKFNRTLERARRECKFLRTILYMGSININPGQEVKENAAPRITVKPGDLAYVIYTSGSTRKPRGVMVEHGNVVRLVKNANYIDSLEWGEDDRYLVTGEFSFDITTFEMWGLLLNGISMTMMDKEVILEAEKLREVVVRNRITMMHLIPPLFNQYIENCPGIFESLRGLLVGGDMVYPRAVTRLRNRVKPLIILHMYGPTENTTFSTFFLVQRDYDQRIPIGKPISHSTVYILDGNGKLQPIGVIGELCTGGAGVVRGYLNNPALTAEKFKRAVIRHSSLVIGESKRAVNSHSSLVIKKLERAVTGHSSLVIGSSSKFSTNDQCPMTNDRSSKSSTNDRFQLHHSTTHHSPHSPLTIYKTGDLARWLADGNIEFLGRKDRQVKVRGFRIELEEIENRLLKHDKIKEAVAVVRENLQGDKQLCVYFVPRSPVSPGAPEGGEPVAASVLREYLAALLPVYMVPSYFVSLESMPLLVSGKIDRKALPMPDRSGIGTETLYVEPGTGLEEIIANIWKKVLKLDRVGVNDHFFSIGGNSINILQVNAQLKKLNMGEIPVAKMFQYTTIRELASFLEGDHGGEGPVDEEEKLFQAIDKGKSKLKERIDRRKRRTA